VILFLSQLIKYVATYSVDFLKADTKAPYSMSFEGEKTFIHGRVGEEFILVSCLFYRRLNNRLIIICRRSR